jgi:chromosome segregation ATPase
MMELTIELEKTKMDVMKEIADSNLILSGLRADIKKMEKDKDEFFQQRQDQLESRLYSFLRNSQSLVKETEENYIYVHNFYEELKKFAELVKEQRNEVKKQLDDLKDKTVDFTNSMNRNIEELSKIRSGINSDFAAIEKEKKYIKQQQVEIAKDRADLSVRNANLMTALKALKERK